MKRGAQVWALPLAALLAATLACTVPDIALVPTDTPTPTDTPIPTNTPMPTLTPTPTPAVQEIDNPEGGFIITIPEDWLSVDVFGSTLITNGFETIEAFLEPPYNLPSGSVVLMIVYVPEEEEGTAPGGISGDIAIDEALDDWATEEVEIVSGPAPFMLDDSPAASAEFRTIEDPTFGNAGGYVLLVDRADGQGGLLLVAIAPEEDWPTFRDDVLAAAASLRLQPIVVEESRESMGERFGTEAWQTGNTIESPGEPPPGFLWQIQRPQTDIEGDFGPLGSILYVPEVDVLVVTDPEFGLWMLDTEEGAVIYNIPLRGETDLIYPTDIAVSPDGETLYIGDWFENNIRVMDPADEQIIGEIGKGELGFFSPEYLAVDSIGNIYASSVDDATEHHELLKFASDGTLLWRIDLTNLANIEDRYSIAVAPDDTIYLATLWDGSLTHISSDGTLLDQTPAFFGPLGDFAIDADGRFYVASPSNGLLMTDPSGQVLASYGIRATGMPYPNGSYARPTSITVAPDGTVYYLDFMWDEYAIIGAFQFP